MSKSSLLPCLGLMAGLLSFTACSRPGSSEPVSEGPRVEGSKIQFSEKAPQLKTLVCVPASAAAVVVHRLTGRLVWDEEHTVRVYSPFAGRVRRLEAQIGDRVEAGASLATIDSPDFGQVQADARKAEADLLLARKTWVRSKDLYEHGAAALKDLEQAENAKADADAEARRAKARLRLYSQEGSSDADQVFVMRAPIAGVVVERNLNPGQELRPDLMLANAPQLLAPQFVISDPQRLGLVLDVTELDAEVVKAGDAVRIVSRSQPGRSFSGVLDTVGTGLDPATRTVRTRGSVDNHELLLKAEMYVDVEIERAGVASAVQVPSGAVFSLNGHSYVFVRSSALGFERREVQVGVEEDGRMVVEAGLKAGEQVLVEGSLLLQAMLEDGGHA